MSTARVRKLVKSSPVEFRTEDGYLLRGVLARPSGRPVRGTVVLLHPNPTGGGSMDMPLLRRARHLLPQHGFAVLAFNTRGTVSDSCGSEGIFDDGRAEVADVRAAVRFVGDAGLSNVWLVGWSFGSDLALMHGCCDGVDGVVVLAPPLSRTRTEHLETWAASARSLTCLVPEFDKYLCAAAARERFAAVPQADIVQLDGAEHSLDGHHDHVLECVAEAVAGPDSLPGTRAS